MSLVFLKNDDQSRDDDVATTDSHLLPWRWTNYFTNPIKIPRNAQVGYVKSSFQQPYTSWVDSHYFYILNGLPELNATIPLYVEGGEVTDWKSIFAEMGRLCNQYGLDGEYNNKFEIQDYYDGVYQTVYGEAGTPPLLTDGIEGYNFLVAANDKLNLRVAQRDTNDTQNQSFNSGGWNGAAGLNTLNITPGLIDYGVIAISSPYYQATGGANGAGWSVTQGRFNPIVGSTTGIAPNFTNWYNVGWTTGIISDPAYAVGSGNPELIPPFNQELDATRKGHYPCVYSRVPIKKWIGDYTPTVPAGHAVEPNGYVVKTFRVWPQAFATTDYPDPNGIAANAGTYAGCFDSFGIQSIELIESMPNNTGLTDSRLKYVAQCDLNSADSPFVPRGAAVPRYFLGCDVEIRGATPQCYPVLSVKILDPEAPIGITQYIELATLDLTAAATAANVCLNCENPVLPGKAAAMLAVRFRWTSPYCMAVEYCFRYNNETDVPHAPGVVGGNPMTEWVMLYDMAAVDSTAAPKYFLPGYLGDLTLVEYPCGNLSRNYRKGWFDFRKGYRLYKNQLLGLDTQMLPLQSTSFYSGLSLYDLRPLCKNTSGGGTPETPKMGGITPEVFAADGRLEKNLRLVLNPIKDIGRLDDNLSVTNVPYFYLNSPDTHIGDQIGLEGAPSDLNNDILGTGNEFIAYGLNGNHTPALNERVASLHIQLMNLPIQSQNGVKSTQNKTIAVVNTFDAYVDNDPINSNNVFNDNAHTINWIDLNNYTEQNLQQIQVLITYDDNTEANSLVNRSDLTIMFRQKPSNPNPDATALPDNITNLLNV